MTYQVVLAGQTYEMEIVDKKIVFRGYDPEGEAIAAQVSGQYSHLLPFWINAQILLDKEGEQNFLKFLASTKNLAEAALNNSLYDEFEDYSEEKMTLLVILYPNCIKAKMARLLTLPEALDYLAHTDSYRYLEAVAGNHRTPAKALDYLANTKERNILRGVASNPNTSTTTLARLSLSFSTISLTPNVDLLAMMELIALNPNTSREVVMMIACNPEMKMFALTNSVLTQEDMITLYNNLSEIEKDFLPIYYNVGQLQSKDLTLLHLLAQSDNVECLLRVCSNPNTRDSDLEIAAIKLANSPHYGVRLRLAPLERLPMSARQILMQDENKAVRNAARNGMKAADKAKDIEI